MHVKNQYIELPLLFCFGLLIFLIGKAGQEVVGFESRFYLFAEEMYRSGLSCFPTTYNQPYADYLATSTGLIYLFARLGLGLSKFVALIPSAIAASLSLIVTYLIGSLYNKRWGFCALLFLLCSFGFLKISRSISLDIYPTLIATYCFYLISIKEQQTQGYSLLSIYLLLILSFLFRGPIGLVMPTGIVCVFYLLNQKYKQFLTFGLIALLILVLATFLLLALAYSVGGLNFMYDVLRMQIVGRIDHTALPYYFYFVDGPVNYLFSFPCAVFTVLMVAIAYYQKQSLPYAKALMQMIAWAAVILIGMSIPGEKKIRYILPALPAFALIAAYPLAFADKQLFTKYVTLFKHVIRYFPGCLLLGLLAVWVYIHQQVISLPIPYLWLPLALLILQCINFSNKNLLVLFLTRA